MHARTRPNRFAVFVVAISIHLIGLLSSALASAQTSCPTGSGSPLTSPQVKSLCDLECRIEASSDTHSPLSPKPEECATADSEVKADLEEPMWKKIASCAASAAYGSLTNIADLLAPADFRLFVTECSRDTACKRNLARDIDLYRQRKPDGTYQMSDQEVDAKIGTGNFVTEYFRSKHDIGTNMDVCQAQLGKITRSLNNALSDAPTDADKQKQLQSRYDQLATFDADCPRLLHITPPGEDHFQPDLNRVAKHTAALIGRQAQGAKADNLLKPVTDFFRDLKISYQCYDGATRRQLMCFAIGHVIDPTMLTGAGVGLAMGAKALIKSGLSRYAKHELIAAQKEVVHEAYRTVDSLRTRLEHTSIAGGPTTEISAELAAAKTAAGKAKVDFALSRSAILRDEFVERAHMNENAFALLEQSTQTKPMSISVKTVREGENAGLVVDPITKQPLKIDKYGITSDADVKKRWRRKAAGPVRFTDEHGFESAESAASRASENAGFKEVDRRSLDRNLVNHGPTSDLPQAFDKLHKPIVLEEKYPLPFYFPNGDIRIVHSKLEEEAVERQIKAAGYR